MQPNVLGRLIKSVRRHVRILFADRTCVQGMQKDVQIFSNPTLNLESNS